MPPTGEHVSLLGPDGQTRPSSLALQLDDFDLARHGLAQRAVSATDDEADPMATLGQRAR